MSLYLCVDCGGSKTAVAICDASGTIVGRALGGPSNYTYIGLQSFASVISATVGQALMSCCSPPATSPVSLPPASRLFHAAWFGISGVDSPAAVAAITPEMSKLLNIPVGPHLVVANDTQLLASPVRLHPEISSAVTVISGTGSICVAYRETDGVLQEMGRVGGWGWILGDEGGGFHVGREAVRQVLWEHDRASVTGKPAATSPLQTRLLEHFGLADIMDILTVIHLPDDSQNVFPPRDDQVVFVQPREKRLSALSPLVFKAAFEDGDPLALRVLGTCADTLASQIETLLSLNDDNPRGIKAQECVISFGGSLAGVEAYRQLILSALAQKGHIFRFIEYIDDAAASGAIGLAAAGLS
ncbi:hypothetical protein HGRIS_002154 [Hohenbuehelia grisea]|uniref:N-acetyl-D-glucosamine kinase n=1 Tax=Hohenbuehelia grisea TaxID=104357 RepID=A0ABR3JLI2_9AGAR